MDSSLNTEASGFCLIIINGTHHYNYASALRILKMAALKPSSVSEPIAYTSIKDILAESSPDTLNGSQGSWNDIPIKDPLLKHAAWAYLQPMLASSMPSSNRSFYEKLKETCGCIGFMKDVVLPSIRDTFGRLFAATSVEDDDGDDDDVKQEL